MPGRSRRDWRWGRRRRGSRPLRAGGDQGQPDSESQLSAVFGDRMDTGGDGRYGACGQRSAAGGHLPVRGCRHAACNGGMTALLCTLLARSRAFSSAEQLTMRAAKRFMNCDGPDISP